MKIDRLLEITIILLNKKNVTAKELADRFEVSIRTIYRDVEALATSGIPIYSNRGSGGGISLLENFQLPKTLISKHESDSILLALKTLQAIKYPEIDHILEKLNALFHSAASDWIQIDFTSWGANPNEFDKMTEIKRSILDCKKVVFDYVNASNNRTTREIEPLKLIFKSKTWYLWGWCCSRNDFRIFRLTRIKNLKMTDKYFNRERVRQLNNSNEDYKSENEPKNIQNNIKLKLNFDSEALFRLYDDYDDGIIHQKNDGTFDIEVVFPDDEWVYSYIMGFGHHVRVIEPEFVREIIKERAKKVYDYYENL